MRIVARQSDIIEQMIIVARDKGGELAALRLSLAMVRPGGQNRAAEFFKWDFPGCHSMSSSSRPTIPALLDI
ncbi:MAG: hypothetical protein ACOH2J_17575 [Allorhizobium sp.]